jgi:hypothetical protein
MSGKPARKSFQEVFLCVTVSLVATVTTAAGGSSFCWFCSAAAVAATTAAATITAAAAKQEKHPERGAFLMHNSQCKMQNVVGVGNLIQTM